MIGLWLKVAALDPKKGFIFYIFLKYFLDYFQTKIKIFKNMKFHNRIVHLRKSLLT